jgi:hypothetical protein
MPETAYSVFRDAHPEHPLRHATSQWAATVVDVHSALTDYELLASSKCRL